MAVPSVNNVLGAFANNNTATLTGYVPTSGANSKLVVVIGRESTSNRTVSGIDYGTTALARVATQELDTGTFDNLCEIWYLDNPLGAHASGNIVVTYSGGTGDSHVLACTVLGVETGGGVTAVTTTSATSPISASITTAVNDSLVMSGHISGQVIKPTATSPHVEYIETDCGSGTCGMGNTNVSVAAATTVEWTVSGTNRSVLCLVAWGPSAAAGGGRVMGSLAGLGGLAGAGGLAGIGGGLAA